MNPQPKRERVRKARIDVEKSHSFPPLARFGRGAGGEGNLLRAEVVTPSAKGVNGYLQGQRLQGQRWMPLMQSTAQRVASSTVLRGSQDSPLSASHRKPRVQSKNCPLG